MNKLVLVQIMALVGALMLAGCEDDPSDLAFTHKDAGGTKSGGGSGGTSASDAGQKPAGDAGQKPAGDAGQKPAVDAGTGAGSDAGN
jgi:hypothetical protein